jgi:hypothetical protein
VGIDILTLGAEAHLFWPISVAGNRMLDSPQNFKDEGVQVT